MRDTVPLVMYTQVMGQVLSHIRDRDGVKVRDVKVSGGYRVKVEVSIVVRVRQGVRGRVRWNTTLIPFY